MPSLGVFSKVVERACTPSGDTHKWCSAPRRCARATGTGSFHFLVVASSYDHLTSGIRMAELHGHDVIAFAGEFERSTIQIDYRRLQCAVIKSSHVDRSSQQGSCAGWKDDRRFCSR